MIKKEFTFGGYMLMSMLLLLIIVIGVKTVDAYNDYTRFEVHQEVRRGEITVLSDTVEILRQDYEEMRKDRDRYFTYRHSDHRDSLYKIKYFLVRKRTMEGDILHTWVTDKFSQRRDVEYEVVHRFPMGRMNIGKSWETGRKHIAYKRKQLFSKSDPCKEKDIAKDWVVRLLEREVIREQKEIAQAIIEDRKEDRLDSLNATLNCD